MSTVLDRIGDHVRPLDMTLRKAVPRGSEHLLLVLNASDGSKVAGQWFADGERATAVARQTRARVHAADVRTVADSGVLLQPGGADRVLTTLHRLAAAPGSTLVAHRAERRGTVRRVDDAGRVTYTKAVRPDRFAAMLAAADVRIDEVAVPRVTGSDPAGGTMTCTALPGRTLQQLLDDPQVPERRIVDLGRTVGQAVARLHAVPPPESARRHDAAAELAVTTRWLGRALAYGLLDRDSPALRSALASARRLLTEVPAAETYLHRDLHDLQVVVDEDDGAGVLDFDLACRGEPALDVANLLVHLELKELLGNSPRGRAAACAEAVVEGYAPSTTVWRRVPAYAVATRLRLVSVYAFRPRFHDVAFALLTDAPAGPLRRSKER